MALWISYYGKCSFLVCYDFINDALFGWLIGWGKSCVMFCTMLRLLKCVSVVFCGLLSFFFTASSQINEILGFCWVLRNEGCVRKGIRRKTGQIDSLRRPLIKGEAESRRRRSWVLRNVFFGIYNLIWSFYVWFWWGVLSAAIKVSSLCDILTLLSVFLLCKAHAGICSQIHPQCSLLKRNWQHKLLTHKNIRVVHSGNKWVTTQDVHLVNKRRFTLSFTDVSISETLMDAWTMNKLIHVSNDLLWHLHVKPVEDMYEHTNSYKSIDTQVYTSWTWQSKSTHQAARLQPTPCCHNITYNGRFRLLHWSFSTQVSGKISTVIFVGTPPAIQMTSK